MKGEFGKDIKSQKLKDMLDYAYNSAILLEWWELEDMSRFIELTNSFAKGYIK
jgi:HSP90 family molecular chaperone